MFFEEGKLHFVKTHEAHECRKLIHAGFLSPLIPTFVWQCGHIVECTNIVFYCHFINQIGTEDSRGLVVFASA